MNAGNEYSPDITHRAVEEERRRLKDMTCDSSMAEPMKNIVINGVNHPGIASHKCVLITGHDGECRCACNKRWQKFNQRGEQRT